MSDNLSTKEVSIEIATKIGDDGAPPVATIGDGPYLPVAIAGDGKNSPVATVDGGGKNSPVATVDGGQNTPVTATDGKKLAASIKNLDLTEQGILMGIDTISDFCEEIGPELERQILGDELENIIHITDEEENTLSPPHNKKSRNSFILNNFHLPPFPITGYPVLEEAGPCPQKVPEKWGFPFSKSVKDHMARLKGQFIPKKKIKKTQKISAIIFHRRGKRGLPNSGR